MVIQVARSTGNCSTCANRVGNTYGFRATLFGQSNSESSPATLSVSRVEIGTSCPNGSSFPPKLVCDHRNPALVAHGSLMLVSWGFLLPCGIISAHFLRHRGPIWFKLHRAIQVTGLTLAIVGWSIALARLDVFFPGSIFPAVIHGAVGILIMCLGIMQPINAYFRPHIMEGDSEEKKTRRRRWEYLHKGSGYTALFLSLFVQIPLGLFLSQSITFLVLYFVFLFLLLVFVAGAKIDFRQKSSEANQL